MEKKDLVWIILISVILVVIISLTIPVLINLPPPGGGQNLPQQPLQEQNLQLSPQGAPGLNIQLKIAISCINIGLIIPLLIIYAGIYRRMRSSFTLGLMAVIFALGMYAVTSSPLIVSQLGGRPPVVGLFQIIPDLCTTVALVILIRISLE